MNESRGAYVNNWVLKYFINLIPDMNFLKVSFLFFTAFSTINQLLAQELKIIHNVADPALATVDIWIKGGASPVIDNFKFREATPFTPFSTLGITMPTALTIGIAPQNSTKYEDKLVEFTVNVDPSQSYFLIANGVRPGAGFAANPDGISTAPELIVLPAKRTSGDNTVHVKVLHGATDAPAVNVLNNKQTPPLISGLKYKQSTPWTPLPANRYFLNITPASSSSTILLTYDVDLRGAEGAAILVYASGFINPSANNDPEGDNYFTLMAALPDTLIELDLATANVQVVHNCADPAAASVDLGLSYTNLPGLGEELLEGFSFRTALPVTPLPAFPITLKVYLSGSRNPVATFENINFDPDENYYVIASGVVDKTKFNTTINSDIGFTLTTYKGARFAAAEADQVDLLVFHGCTDAPGVDVVVRENNQRVVNNLTYSRFNPYISVPEGKYTLQIRPAGSSTNLAAYTADLTGLRGASGLVMASGFLEPSKNQNGRPFGLFLVTTAGGPVTPLQLATSIDPVINKQFRDGLAVYPNPVNDFLFIKYDLAAPSPLSIKLFDLQGKLVKEMVSEQPLFGAGELQVQLSDLNEGLYFWQVHAIGAEIYNGKIQIRR
jgi:hypothetical protein